MARVSVLLLVGWLAVPSWSSSQGPATATSGREQTPQTTETPQATENSETSASRSQAVPYSLDSIERGKTLFERHCTECHGPDGKAHMDVIADATDLTAPDRWYSGTERQEVFSSIRDGAGVSMPPYQAEFEDPQIWDLVNFTQSLWPEDRRPKLEKP
jgi:mono/diheme cytochrome c family protein